MKSRILYCASCFVVVLLTLLPTGLAQAQNLCTFDPTVAQGPAPPPPAQANPPYFVWKAGGRGDQSTVANQHSGLVTWTDTIDDETFAGEFDDAIDDGGAAYAQIPLVFVFGECFGGGMIDDLNDLPINNPISIVSASFFNQVALYPLAGGNGNDFVWAYVHALANLINPTAQTIAAQAATDDPFGWSPRPTPARNGETRGSETPEYYSWNNGDNTAIVRPANETNAVILWAGRPKQVDDQQLAQMFLNLIARGYNPNNIVVLFASGAPANSPALVAAMQNVYGGNMSHLRPATQAALTNVLTTWAFPAGVQNPPQYVFFMAVDHGCNNAFQVFAKGGNGGYDIEDGGSWGTEDPDYPIYPPRY